jgi:hypothetical protein
VRIAFAVFLAIQSLGANASSQRWLVDEAVDPISREKSVYAYISAADFDKGYGFRHDSPPTLTVRCSRKKIEVIIMWQSMISCGRTVAEFRLPNGKTQRERMIASTDCQANFFNSPSQFLRDIANGGEFVVRFVPNAGKVTVLRWDLPDFQPVRRALSDSCNF